MIETWRAKRVDNKEAWEYGCFYYDDDCDNGPFIIQYSNFDLSDRLVIPVILGTECKPTQFPDKNDNIIFEHDIIKITDLTMKESFKEGSELIDILVTRTYLVFWNRTKWSVKLLSPSLAGQKDIIFDFPTENVKYEVIGNKFDNPELLVN